MTGKLAVEGKGGCDAVPEDMFREASFRRVYIRPSRSWPFGCAPRICVTSKGETSAASTSHPVAQRHCSVRTVAP